VLSLLASPAWTIDAAGSEAKDLEKIMIINALDLLYFWMYQPRAQNILQDRLRKLSVEKRKILLRSQFILRRRHDIEQMLQDGLIGRNYERALAFYQEHHQEYLSAMSNRTND
jgi:hypothetical protein